jgi:hypothetical protein
MTNLEPLFLTLSRLRGQFSTLHNAHPDATLYLRQGIFALPTVLPVEMDSRVGPDFWPLIRLSRVAVNTLYRFGLECQSIFEKDEDEAHVWFSILMGYTGFSQIGDENDLIILVEGNPFFVSELALGEIETSLKSESVWPEFVLGTLIATLNTANARKKPLTDLQCRCLETLLKMEATERNPISQRKTAEKIEHGADENYIKTPMALLSGQGYVGGKRGRNGGNWITEEGKTRLAEEKKAGWER